MRKFGSKTELLLEVREISDEITLPIFLRKVASDPLNNVRIKTTGTTCSQIDSLKSVSKALLENAFNEVFGEFYEEDDDSDDDFEDDEEEADCDFCDEEE